MSNELLFLIVVGMAAAGSLVMGLILVIADFCARTFGD